MRARRIALAVAVAGLLAATLGTGGFGVTAADRGLALAVADDESAYLRVDQTAEGVPGGVAKNVTVALGNAFPGRPPLSVTVAVEGRGSAKANGPPDGVGAPSGAGSGPGAAASATLGDDPVTLAFSGVPCGATLRIEAVGDGVRVEMTRPVRCEPGE